MAGGATTTKGGDGMALRTPKFAQGQKVNYQGQEVTVVERFQQQKTGTVNIRNRFGYVETVKAKDLKELS
jgi:hypothetical protein